MNAAGKLAAVALPSLLIASTAWAAPKPDAAAAKSASSQSKQAAGTPQRSDDIPPGLERNRQREVPGLVRALEATEGSNSRLQDMPASP